MNDSNQTLTHENNPLAVSPVRPLLVNFAVPSIIAMLVGSIYNLVDQFFIGQTVGVLGNSATNVAYPLVTLCTAVALLFGIGSASAFNLAMGKKEYDKAPWFIGNAAVLLFLSGIILCVITLLFLTPLLRLFGSPDDVLPYAQTYTRICAFGYPFLILTTGGGHLIRADGSPRMTMICSLSGAIVNIGLDALFVMGLGMGMAGAALATIIGQILSGCIVIWYLVRRFHTVPLQRKHLRPQLKIVARLSAIGAGNCFTQLSILLLQVVLNNSLRYYGELSVYGSAIPLAVAGIVMKVNQISLSVIIGIGQGSQPILSFNYGAGQYDRVRQTYRLALTSAAVVGIVSFAAYQLFPSQILGLFGEGSEEYFEFGVRFFRIFLMMTCINFMQPVSSNFFTSLGKPLQGVFLSLTRQVIFLIPLMILFPFFWGIDGILYAGPIADTMAFIAAIFMVWREFRNMRKLEAKA